MMKIALSILAAVQIAMLTGCATMYDATIQNDIASVQSMIDKGTYVDSTFEYGRTSLFEAAKNGYTDLANLLITRGANVNSRDQFGDSPLMWAALKGNTDIVKMLIDNGANVNNYNEDNNSPLTLAASVGFIDPCKILVEKGANVNNVNKDGDTALILAEFGDYEKVGMLLINHGANVDVKNNHGNTPLMGAARNGHIEVINAILDKSPDINGVNEYGDTALIWTGAYGQTAAAKLLIANGANVAARNKAGKSAPDLARENNKTDTYNAMVSAQQPTLAVKKKKVTPKLTTELNALISKNDMKGLRAFLDTHPEMLSAIENNNLRLHYTGPAELRIIDIEQLAKNNKKDTLIIAQINSAGGPYKKFSINEMDDLQKMGISDEVIAAMIAITTEYNKEQQRLAEQDRSNQLAMQQTQQPVQQPVQQQVAEEPNTPIECLKLVAAIKACDQTSGFMSMGCKAVARSQFDCPIPVETLMH